MKDFKSRVSNFWSEFRGRPKLSIIRYFLFFGAALFTYIFIYYILQYPYTMISFNFGKIVNYVTFTLLPLSYENLVSLNSHEFAIAYMFVHTSLHLLPIIFSVFTLLFLELCRIFSPILWYESMNYEISKFAKRLEGQNKSGLYGILWLVGLSIFFLLLQIYLWFYPLTMEPHNITSTTRKLWGIDISNRRRFTPDERGIYLLTLYACFSVFYFMWLTFIYHALFHVIFWPKLKSLFSGKSE